MNLTVSYNVANSLTSWATTNLSTRNTLHQVNCISAVVWSIKLELTDFFESNTPTSMSRCLSSVRSQTVTLYRPMCYPAANLSSVLSVPKELFWSDCGKPRPIKLGCAAFGYIIPTRGFPRTSIADHELSGGHKVYFLCLCTIPVLSCSLWQDLYTVRTLCS
jgi:hypothetical protein